MKTFKKFLNAKTRTVDQIAKKHGVSVSDIEDQLKMGMSVEKEHSKHDEITHEIALDHLWEKPDYYSKLKKVEGS